MILAPLLIALTSLPLRPLDALWRVPSEQAPSAVQREWEIIHARWTGAAGDLEQQFPQPETVNVLG